MSSSFIQESLARADMSISGDFMQDALLLHVSECQQCLSAAIGPSHSLKEQGCSDFQRLATALNVPAEAIQRVAVDEGHLGADALEEYLFSRLSPVERAAANRHLDRCTQCQSELVQQREFVACLKLALSSWMASCKLPPPLQMSISSQTPKFSSEAIAAAQEKLPVSRIAGIQALRLLEREDASLDQLDRVIKTDPVLSGHLIRVANSALLSYGREARTVGEAIGRIGLDRTRLHVCGVAMKRMYSSPQLQKIWNHSILAAQVARQLAAMTHGISPDEASLVALVHDIGHLVLANLGQPYERARATKMSRGMLPVQIEEDLCGVTHAIIGADLLSSWRFPPDMVEAVRSHHSPSDRSSPLAGLLYLAENWLDNQEDVCDLNLFRTSMRRLGLSRADLQTLSIKDSPDLELLRFAA